MGDWKTFVDKTKELLKSKNFSAAKEEFATGLQIFPYQFNLLTIASDVYRASGDRKKSLEYAELQVTHHSDKFQGYGRAAQDLVVLKRFEEAQTKIQSGLERFPYHLNLLTIATNAYRASGDHKKSLYYSELLLTHHPENWHGYYYSAKNLVAFRRFGEAQIKTHAGLEKFPNQLNLLIIATDVHRAYCDREKSIKYSELLITHHPENWNGYARAAQDLIFLKRFDEALSKLIAGLEKFPNHLNLLIIATDVHRASGNREKSLGYSELLITHHPENWNGYARAAQDLIFLRRFDEAQTKARAGLKKFPDQIDLLVIPPDIYRASGNFEKSLECSQRLHNAGVELPLEAFSELLIYATGQNNTQDSVQNQNQIAAIDYFFNRQSLLSNDRMPFNFIFIPKNACTSIKYSLLNCFTDLSINEIRHDPHKMAYFELMGNIDFDKDFYCLVRNPFSRFISGFTDKCRPGGDRNVWLPMCKRYGFNPASNISMNTLLDALLADKHNLINRHFRPQHKITCSSSIFPARIFHIETLNEFSSFLQTHQCEFIRHSPHSTQGKAIKPCELKQKVIDKIYRLYLDDFTLYGYSEDPNAESPQYSLERNPYISELLTSTDKQMPLRNTKERDSLLFEDPYLGRKESLDLLVKYASK